VHVRPQAPQLPVLDRDVSQPSVFGAVSALQSADPGAQV
jgi:hypothetical protein